ncbi:MAG TPA: isochorismatase family protein [Thermoanaerobaculia bacterium]|nr:isochorismatase family protein [Thermoanaerobaculia bacterium]
MDRRHDNIRYLISIIAGLASIILGLVYCFWPLMPTSLKIHELVIQCIPEAIVALVAIPIVYWLFERRGIVPPRQEQITRKSDGMTVILAEIEKASRETEEIKAADRIRATDLLIVVDVQGDFIFGSLKAHDASKIIAPLNAYIKIAEAKGMVIVFTRDWHPSDHWSFKENGGPWATHCVEGTRGAQLTEDLYVPPGSVIIDFGVDPGLPGYSPLENRAFEAILESPSLETVYIAGIALEYCVQSTCIGVRDKGKRVVALESLIATASENVDDAERVWEKLLNIGVEREKRHAALPSFRV